MFLIVLFVIGLLTSKKVNWTESVGWFLDTYFSFQIKIKHFKTLRQIKKVAVVQPYMAEKKQYAYQVITAYSYSISIGLSSLFFSQVSIFYVAFIMLFIALLPHLKLQEREKKIDDAMITALPRISLKLLLLTRAGLPMIKALKEITEKRNNILESQLNLCTKLILTGESSEHVFMDLAEKSQNPFITRLIRIIISEGKHGTKETHMMLTDLNKDIWLHKKSYILKKGEEASTKLLLPMSIAFISIIVAITLPALYQLFTFY